MNWLQRARSLFSALTTPIELGVQEDEGLVKSMQVSQPDEDEEKFDALLDKQTDGGRT